MRRATEQMGMQKDEVVVIGDQMLTDVFGGNRHGLYTIMVVPVKIQMVLSQNLIV